MRKKLFLSLICLGLILGLVTGCRTSMDDSKKYDINVNAPENIDVKTYVNYDKDYLIVYLTNNNNYNIKNLDVNTKFYDKNGNDIGDDSNALLDFVSGGNYVFTIDLPHDDDYNNYVPERIDLSIEVAKEYEDVLEM